MLAKSVKLGLIGASGRLGKTILETSQTRTDLKISLKISKDEDFTNIPSVDGLIDVSTPRACENYICRLLDSKINIPYVIGCTGFTEAQWLPIQEYSKSAPVLIAPNFSLGVTAWLQMLSQHSNELKKLGFSVQISETHHLNKKDKPSGTSKAIAKQLDINENQINSIRKDSVVGVHTVTFQTADETLIFSHEAHDRTTFANGALHAAVWLVKINRNGLFSMADTLVQ